MPAHPLATSIHQLLIPCKDVLRSTAFYRDVVGLQFLFEATGLAFFDCGGVRLMLSNAPDEKLDLLNSVIYFGTDDIDEATNEVVAKGGELISAPHVIARLPGRDVWLSHWKDLEGNRMSFMQEKPA